MLPFVIGQAVVHVVYLGSKRSAQPFTLGEVRSVGNDRLALRPIDGRRIRAVHANCVAHAGWCTACEQPAHLKPAGLICPSCGQATDCMPPDWWVLKVFPPNLTWWPRVLRRALEIDPMGLSGDTLAMIRAELSRGVVRRSEAA